MEDFINQSEPILKNEKVWEELKKKRNQLTKKISFPAVDVCPPLEGS